MNRPDETLEMFLQTHDNNYYATYQDIKKDAHEAWNEPCLLWYTDHGPEHSKRLIKHLDGLCKGLLRDPQTGNPEYGLTPMEVFLLLAAAWLHDIGMQDLTGLPGGAPEHLTEADWDEVRKRHPARTHDIIMQYAPGGKKEGNIRLTLKEQPKFHKALALICKGHGSDYFEEVTQEFSLRPYDIDGQYPPVRGQLLTALSMMADELDLHNARAVSRPNIQLSKVSKLHHYRHHYVGGVSVGSGAPDIPGAHRRIDINYEFPTPEEEHKNWADQIKRWIKEKLEKEAARAKPYLIKGFDGHFSWAEPLIETNTHWVDPEENKAMEPAIRSLLASQFQKVIDWKDITRELKERFKSKTGGVVCLTGTEDHGMGRFIEFIDHIFAAAVENHSQTAPVAVLNFREFDKFHSCDEVLQITETKLEGTAAGKTDESIFKHLHERHDFSLVILQHLDRTGQKNMASIHEHMINKFSRKPGNLLLLVTTDKKAPLFNHLTTYELPGAFEDSHIYDYFLDIEGSEDMARAKVERYKELLTACNVTSPSPQVSINLAGTLSKHPPGKPGQPGVTP
jgi:hypothetical protein